MRADWLRGHLDTVRVRLTIGAAVVVGIALLVGAAAVVTVMRQTLLDNLQQTAEFRAADIAHALGATAATPPLDAFPDEQLVQVLDAAGGVVVSSTNVAGRPALAIPPPGGSIRLDEPIADEGAFLAVSAEADSAVGPRTVVVARSLDDVTELTEPLTRVLLVGLPALLLVVGLTIWRIVGRALAPVDAIRREVDEISGRRLDRRVPEPARRDEISRLAATMNRMLGRLEESQTRQLQFVSDASHELRSPVASIRQHSEVALAHPDRTTVPELAATVLAEDLRVQRLVDDLLLLARSDEQDIASDAMVVDLDDVVFAEATRLRGQVSFGQLRDGLLINVHGVSAGRVRGDSAGLRRMISSLGDNAVRHARSTVSFALSEDDRDGAVVLRVDDDGPGIPLEQRERVFERFVRLDDARARDAGGSGLGLAIVEAVARTHGGTAAVSESPGGGARVEVRLPLVSD